MLPILQEPHAFEKLTAEHLRKAYAQGLKKSGRNYSGSLTVRPIGRGVEVFRALQSSSTTTFFMKVDGKFREVELAAKQVFNRIMGTSDGGTGAEDEVSRSMSLPSPSENGEEEEEEETPCSDGMTLSFTDIAQIMPRVSFEALKAMWDARTRRQGRGRSSRIAEGNRLASRTSWQRCEAGGPLKMNGFQWFSVTSRGAFERFHMIAATAAGPEFRLETSYIAQLINIVRIFCR